ncbi:hypothetical protein AG1IA_02040 [Rhizoctonia solani AG-1 IA]|uniref:Uncharacterized protein n=1 Tax=Thanatephorus cucumeris (strain AG1-IA) TaxID=983506 RepID=L8X125_THACA|nr:hypothetical protein AG1IA_02040 [Rhizoctonia solani AG-1 IA]
MAAAGLYDHSHGASCTRALILSRYLSCMNAQYRLLNTPYFTHFREALLHCFPR